MYFNNVNMDSISVLGTVRVMDFKGYAIHYYTGLLKNEVYISVMDVIDIMKNHFNKKIGTFYVSKILIDAGIIPNYVKVQGDDFIDDYVNNQCVLYTGILKVCDYYGLQQLKSFLQEAVKMIDDIGVYIEDLKYNYNKKYNNEMNVSDELRMQDIETYVYNNDSYYCNEPSIYESVVDKISFLVFGTDMSQLRWNLGLYSNQKVSDNITDDEFNEVAVASKMFSYLLSCNFNLDIDYMAFLVNNVLELKCRRNKKTKRSNISDITTGEYEKESDNIYADMFNNVQVSNEHNDPNVDDFYRYM